MYKTLIPTLIFCAWLFTGCNTDQENEQQSTNFQIINALNQQDADRALALIENQLTTDPNNAELQYWKAQAYAIKGGIDVYSLFPIIKMKLFDVAMTEWSSMSEYSKKSKQEINLTLLGEQEIESKEDLNQLEQDIKNMPTEDITFEIKVITEDAKYGKYQSVYEGSGNYYDYQKQEFINHDGPYFQTNCYADLEISSNILYFNEKLYEQAYAVYTAPNPDTSDFCQEALGKEVERMLGDFELNPTLLKSKIRQKALWIISDKKAHLEKRQYGNRMINGIYALYDSMPIIQNVPDITANRTNAVNQSLELLTKLKNETQYHARLGRNVRQQMGLLGGYLILGGIKDSFKLENIKEPADFICNMKSQNIVANYSNFLTGLRALIEATIDTEFAIKNNANLMEIRKALEEAPEELSEEQIDDVLDFIEELEEDYC